jgi:hypothetical protein
MNAHVMRRLGVSRRDLFERIERPALSPGGATLAKGSGAFNNR